ncbi:hypothetical protein ACFWG0_37655 [Streptomyces yangpuensis]|uniref:hypothetical protein n=1 Tax=Streptomyces yangpuensis TaxID=1648182 RepID=UPI0036669FFA
MIVTIVASIAGLVTTGVATLFSARVANDQLKQSRQAAEEKRQAQAARFSYWVDTQQDGKQRLHLMNRSPDPFSDIFLSIRVYLDLKEIPLVPERWASFSVYMPGFPPCSEMVLTSNNMRYRNDRSVKDGDKLTKDKEWLYWKTRRTAWNPQYDDLPTRGGWRDLTKIDHEIDAYSVKFTDRDGVQWRRTSGHLTRILPMPERPDDHLLWGVVQAVPSQPLKSCGN